MAPSESAISQRKVAFRGDLLRESSVSAILKAFGHFFRDGTSARGVGRGACGGVGWKNFFFLPLPRAECCDLVRTIRGFGITVFAVLWRQSVAWLWAGPPGQTGRWAKALKGRKAGGNKSCVFWPKRGGNFVRVQAPKSVLKSVDSRQIFNRVFIFVKS